MTMIKILTRLLVAGAAAAYLHAAAPASAEEVAVKIGNFTFGPQELKVKAGTTVTWTNEDDIPHTVVSANTFRSKVMDTDGKFSFTFTTPGTGNEDSSLGHNTYTYAAPGVYDQRVRVSRAGLPTRIFSSKISFSAAYCSSISSKYGSCCPAVSTL